MTYRIEMTQRTDGSDLAEIDWNGTRLSAASRHGAEMALARKLVAAGAPDGRWVMVSPGSDKIRMHGNSLAALATLTISEGDRAPPRVKPFEAFPRRDGDAATSDARDT